MVNEQRILRASDDEREAVVSRLRAAHDDGRLQLDEYVDRMSLAFDAKTHGELAVLLRDLPAARRSPEPAAAQAPDTCPPRAMPPWLVVMWAVWASVVALNVVIWGLVSVSHFSPHYFWPMWVAGPWGVVLSGVTAGVVAVRQSRTRG